MSLEDPYEGQKFTSFEVLKKYLEEYGQRNFVKFWIRSSHTISSLKSKSTKRMNPNLKYVCMKFACIFGGEKIRCRGSGIRRSTTYRNLGCPCMINAVVGEDGNHVKLETVVLEHNHALCKSLYDSLKKSKSKIRMLQSGVKVNKNNPIKEGLGNNVLIKKENDDQSSNCDDSVQKLLHKPQLKTGNFSFKKENNYGKELEVETSDSSDVQNYLKHIQEKYGNNIKIIVVNRDESENKGVKLRIENIQPKCEILEEADEEEKEGNSNEQIYELQNEYEHLGPSREKEICRLCLSSSNKLSPIFKPTLPLESTILSFKIMSCASIEVRNDDELPCNICTTCEEILDIAYNFRIKCENSDSLLRKVYSSNRYIHANGISNNYSYCKGNGEEQTCDESAAELAEEDVGDDGVKNEQETAFDCNRAISNDSGEAYAKFDETCPICGNIFETYLDMLNHMKEHSDVENFILTCNLCSVIFTTAKSLLEHMNEHMIDINNDWTNKLISCSQCELSFLTVEDAKVHEETHAQREEEESLSSQVQIDKNSSNGYLCNVCGKILKSKDRFQSHRNTHEGLRPHICLKCGRGFADRKNMHQHYDIVHLRKAKHECPICHKKFYAPTKMKSHITMHYGVKPFSCDVCNKTFRLRMNMIKHKKTHSNERPHKCDKCNAAFIDKNLLTRHSYVHGGIRPYVCPFCGHRFTLKFSLKKHMRSGRCSGKTNVKDVNWEYNIEEWTATSTTDVGTCLPEPKCEIKDETSEPSNFSQENESIKMNDFHDYEQKQ